MIRLALIAWLALCGVANAQLSGGLMFPGPGTPASSGAAYVGPLDAYGTGVIGAYSCAQAASAAYASALSNMCRVTRASDSTQCILKAAATGSADIATANCNSNTQTIIQFCNATTCGIDTAYDHSGNGRDATQATQANMPVLVFNSTPTGTLPAMDCGTAASNRSLTSANITQAQPLTFYGVATRTSDFTVQGGILGGNVSGLVGLASSSSTNNAVLNINATVAVTRAATDSAWHTMSALATGVTNSALNVDGGETTGSSATNGFSANGIRLCRGGTSQYPGQIAEAILYATSSNTNRNDLNTNSRLSNRYNY